MHVHHRSQAGELHRDAGPPARRVQRHAQRLAAGEQRLGRGGVEDLPHGDAPRGHGPDVVVEGAGMRQRARLVAVEDRHDVGPAAEGAEAHAAGHVLAERGHVGDHALPRLQPARAVPARSSPRRRSARAPVCFVASRSACRNSRVAGMQPPEPIIGSTSTAASWSPSRQDVARRGRGVVVVGEGQRDRHVHGGFLGREGQHAAMVAAAHHHGLHPARDGRAPRPGPSGWPPCRCW